MRMKIIFQFLFFLFSVENMSSLLFMYYKKRATLVSKVNEDKNFKRHVKSNKTGQWSKGKHN